MLKATKIPKIKPETRLVEVHGKKIITSSLLVAAKFGKRHDNVLKKIDTLIASQPEFSHLNFKAVEYIDQKGEARKSYELTEEGFAMIAMRFTGKAAEDWQIKFVSAFQKMRRILTEPGRKEQIKIKCTAGSDMTETLKAVFDVNGKEPKPHHFQNEHKFCNRALTGVWSPIIETDLDTYDARLLSAIRKKNALLMIKHIDQADRRHLLDEFIADYREKHTRPVIAVNGMVV